MTGGYGGFMEAVSEGAFNAGGKVTGVLCRAFGSRGKGNAFLTHRVWTDTLIQRQDFLLRASRSFIAFPGQSGTLAEVTGLWSLWKSGSLPVGRLALMGNVWQPLHLQALEGGWIDPLSTSATRWCESGVEALKWLENGLA